MLCNVFVADWMDLTQSSHTVSRARRRKPLDVAKENVQAGLDQPGLTQLYINNFIGMPMIAIVFLSIFFSILVD